MPDIAQALLPTSSPVRNPVRAGGRSLTVLCSYRSRHRWSLFLDVRSVCVLITAVHADVAQCQCTQADTRIPSRSDSLRAGPDRHCQRHHLAYVALSPLRRPPLISLLVFVGACDCRSPTSDGPVRELSRVTQASATSSAAAAVVVGEESSRRGIRTTRPAFLLFRHCTEFSLHFGLAYTRIMDSSESCKRSANI
jgi:hypothetical protein